jgi:hypothetical protein
MPSRKLLLPLIPTTGTNPQQERRESNHFQVECPKPAFGHWAKSTRLPFLACCRCPILRDFETLAAARMIRRFLESKLPAQAGLARKWLASTRDLSKTCPNARGYSFLEISLDSLTQTSVVAYSLHAGIIIS